MKIRIKRIYETPSAEDGKRIFVDRLWARGVKKEEAKIDSWEREIAPSAELRKWYGHDPDRFEEFRKRYREELNTSPAAAAFAEKVASCTKTVTILFGAKDETHSNAAVLLEWLEERMDSPSEG